MHQTRDIQNAWYKNQELQGEIEKPTAILGDSNTSLLMTDRTSR